MNKSFHDVLIKLLLSFFLCELYVKFFLIIQRFRIVKSELYFLTLLNKGLQPLANNR